MELVRNKPSNDFYFVIGDPEFCLLRGESSNPLFD